MADYVAVLKRAIESVGAETPEARKALYDKARTALIAQLESRDPPLSALQLAEQKAALDRAARAVENEYAGGFAAALAKKTEEKTAETAAPAAPEADTGAEKGAEDSPPPVLAASEKVAEAAEAVAAKTSDVAGAVSQKAGDASSTAVDTIDNAVDAATEKAQDAAGAVSETVSSVTGSVAEKATEAVEATTETAKSAAAAVTETAGAAADKASESVSEAAAHGREVLHSAAKASTTLGQAASTVNREARTMLGGESASQAEAEEVSAIVEKVEAAETRRRPEPQVSESEAAEIAPAKVDTGRNWGWLWLVLILIVVGGGAAFGWMQRDALKDWVGQFTASSEDTAEKPVVKNEERLTPGGDNGAAQPETAPVPNAADRAEAPAQTDTETAPSSEPSEPPATQAALIEENPSDANQAQAIEGSVTWSTREDKGDIVIQGLVDIPERRFSMSMVISRNTDATLPASHIVELTFTVPSDFPGGGISNVPGLLLKATPQAQGVPLAGESVRVTNGYFWVALSQVDVELRRNMGELESRDYIDIPLIYDNSRRAILSIAKGPDGQKAFAEALQAWQN